MYSNSFAIIEVQKLISQRLTALIFKSLSIIGNRMRMSQLSEVTEDTNIKSGTIGSVYLNKKTL